MFTFTIPLPSSSLQQIPLTGRQEAAPAGQKLLIIEDNDINRLLLEKMLGDLGHDVTSMSGGEAGIDALRTTTFDLVITDISMPGIDGMEVLRRARDEHLADGTDVVALTAHAAEDDQLRILNAGFAEVLTKPIDRGALADTIARHGLGRSDGARSGPPEPAQSEDSDIKQFVDAIGSEKAQHFLTEFGRDVRRLSNGLEQCEELTETHRQEAHRLAGSAAVLGLTDLRASMLQIEQANTNTVPALNRLRSAWSSADGILRRYIGTGS